MNGCGSIVFLDVTPSVSEFDEVIVGGNLAEFLGIAQKLGGEIAEHALLVKKAFAYVLCYVQKT